jgi:ATP adenylyltransferase
MTRASVPNLSPDRRSEPTCLFSALRNSERIVLRNELALALRDTTPGSDLHTLVLPFRHARTYFDLSRKDSPRRMTCWGGWARKYPKADPSVEGFIGANVGLVSGHTIFHCHIHLIPRHRGDVENPLGGVRGVIPARMRY